MLARLMATLVLLIAVLVGSSARAAADVPAEQAALIMTRALAYDRNLAKRADGEVRLAVVVRAGDPGSKRDGDKIYRVFKKLEGKSIQKLPFKVVLVEYSSAASLENVVSGQDVDALYVGEALGGELGSIRDIARKHKVTTLASHPRYLSGGLCLALEIEDGKPRIVLNRRAADAEGASFAAALLRLARVV